MIFATSECIFATSNDGKKNTLHLENYTTRSHASLHFGNHDVITAISILPQVNDVIVGFENGNLIRIVTLGEGICEQEVACKDFFDLEEMVAGLETISTEQQMICSFSSSVQYITTSQFNITGFLSNGHVFHIDTDSHKTREVGIEGHVVSKSLQPTHCYICQPVDITVRNIFYRDILQLKGLQRTDDLVFFGMSDGSLQYTCLAVCEPRRRKEQGDNTFHIVPLNTQPYSLTRTPVACICILSPSLDVSCVPDAGLSPDTSANVCSALLCAVHVDGTMSIYSYFPNYWTTLQGHLVKLPEGANPRNVVAWEGLLLLLCNGHLFSVFIEQKTEVSTPSLSSPSLVSSSSGRYITDIQYQDVYPSASTSTSSNPTGHLLLRVEHDVQWLTLPLPDVQGSRHATSRDVSTRSAPLTWHQAYAQQCHRHVDILRKAFSEAFPSLTGSASRRCNTVVEAIRDALSETSTSYEAEKCLRYQLREVDEETLQMSKVVRMLQKQLWPASVNMCLHFDPPLVAMDLHTVDDMSYFRATLSMETSSELVAQALQGREVCLSWWKEGYIPGCAPGGVGQVVFTSTACVHFRTGDAPCRHPQHTTTRINHSVGSTGQQVVYACRVALSLPIATPVRHHLEVNFRISAMHPDVLQSSLVSGVREQFQQASGSVFYPSCDSWLPRHDSNNHEGAIDAASAGVDLPWGIVPVSTCDVMAAVSGTHVASIGVDPGMCKDDVYCVNTKEGGGRQWSSINAT